MHLVYKGTDPVHCRLDFLNKAVGNGSLCHHTLTYRHLHTCTNIALSLSLLCNCLSSSVRLLGWHTKNVCDPAASLVTCHTSDLCQFSVFSVCRYPDRKLALLLSPIIAVLNQVWRNWFVLLEKIDWWLFEEALEITSKSVSWQTAGWALSLQCEVSNAGWCYCYYYCFNHCLYCMSTMH